MEEDSRSMNYEEPARDINTKKIPESPGVWQRFSQSKWFNPAVSFVVSFVVSLPAAIFAGYQGCVAERAREDTVNEYHLSHRPEFELTYIGFTKPFAPNVDIAVHVTLTNKGGGAARNITHQGVLALIERQPFIFRYPIVLSPISKGFIARDGIIQSVTNVANTPPEGYQAIQTRNS
jgi:hypothetical protein